MTDNQLIIKENDVLAIVQAASGALQLNAELEPVTLKSITETIDPTGEFLKASDLVDQTFTIRKLKPIESSFDDSSHFYWVVAVTEHGEIINTAIGGKACVEMLDLYLMRLWELNNAQKEGDDNYVRALTELGIGRPITVTLRRKAGGKYGRYYQFD